MRKLSLTHYQKAVTLDNSRPNNLSGNRKDSFRSVL